MPPPPPDRAQLTRVTGPLPPAPVPCLTSCRINERDLLNVSVLEQEMACYDEHSKHYEKLVVLLQVPLLLRVFLQMEAGLQR